MMHLRALPPVEASRLAGDEGERWYALLVLSQKEHAAREWLRAKGVYSFFPSKTERRKTRSGWAESERRLAPGYVFARFPGEPAWHRILWREERDKHLPKVVREVIRLKNGEPGRIHPDSLQRLFDMRATEGELNAKWHLARRLKRHDRARIRGGVYDGQEIEVREIKGLTAKFALHLFGADIETEMDLARLEKIEAK